MNTVNIFLNFDGNCLDAFKFYKGVFQRDFTLIRTYEEMPLHFASDEVPEEFKNRIMHICLPISNETMLMGSDSGGEWAAKIKPGNNYSISINTQDPAEADRLFNSLSANGHIIMPMANTFWNSYFGMFNDKFGVQWMINSPLKSLSLAQPVCEVV